MPEFIEADDMNPRPTRPMTIFDIVFAIIAVLASGFSGYTTFIGFAYDLPFPLALVISIIVGLGLLIINFRIKDARIRGDNVGATLVAFLLFFVVSFISNTNAIYTYFLQNDIVGEAQTKAWHIFDKGTQSLLSALGQSDFSVEANRVKQDLDLAKRNLRNQILDPGNPGMGPKARQHLQEVETILGVNLTRLQPPSPNSSSSSFEKYADRLEDQIDNAFATQFRTTRSQAFEIDGFRDKLMKLRALYNNTITEKQFNSDTTDLMKSDLASLYVEADKLIGYHGERLEIDNSVDDIGSFQYTWNNFFNLTNVPAIILSIIISIVLDILTPTLSLLLYKPEMEF
jgi:hypothetical protein